MNWMITALLSFLCATLSALGMGGGGILLIYLVAYGGLDQLAAQGINLVFFVPVALVAILIHARQGRIRWKVALRCVGLGILGVYCGYKLATMIESDLLSKLFGGFLLIIGIREIFSKPKTAQENEKKAPPKPD
jgi:uncharacterized membrane protein YfcA